VRLELGGRLVHRLVPLTIALATVAAFLPALGNGFVNWDDDQNLLQNPRYRGLGLSQLTWMFTTFHLGHYIPVTWITFALDYLLWGMRPVGYHLTSLLLHAGAAVVFYFVALRLLQKAIGGGKGPPISTLPVSAGVAALAFALHPLRVESVAWVTERRDVLSGLFYLLAILAYLRACEAPPGQQARDFRWYSGAIGFFVLALLSKSMAVSLPVILLVLDIYPLRRLRGGPWQWLEPRARQVVSEKVPFVLLSLAASAVAILALMSTGGNVAPLAKLGVMDRLAISAYSLAFYLWKTAVPLNLAAMHELPSPLEPLSWPFLLAGVVVLVISVVAIVARRHWPALPAVWVAYIVILLPVLGIVQNGHQIAADRYTYLACLGWALLAGAATAHSRRAGFHGRGQITVLVGILAFSALTGLGVLTWRQVQVWHDTERLWRHALATHPSAVAHDKLGVVLADRGELDPATNHFREAVRIRPEVAAPHYNLGTALAARGRLEEAIDHFRRAVEIKPDHAGAHHNWGVALATLGRLDEAIAHLREAVRIGPGDAVAHTSLGSALARRGELREAINHLHQALRIDPELQAARVNLERALHLRGL
jgi:tetratricopeptide (TPR) repeat protein